MLTASDPGPLTTVLRVYGWDRNCTKSRVVRASLTTSLTANCAFVPPGELPARTAPCSNCRYPVGGRWAGMVTVGRAGFACGISTSVVLKVALVFSIWTKVADFAGEGVACWHAIGDARTTTHAMTVGKIKRFHKARLFTVSRPLGRASIARRARPANAASIIGCTREC